MAELRVTVGFPDAVGGDQRTAWLRDLGAALQRELSLDERPRPIPDPGDDGELRPMLLVDVGDADGCAVALRTLGGWYMRHPACVLRLKATGPGGRVGLELRRFSTVAFAEAVTRLRDAF